MEVINLREFPKESTLLSKDDNGREINVYKLNYCIFRSSFYPSVIIESEYLYNPIDEKIMSLEKVDRTIKLDLRHLCINIETNPVFFFIYNTDNYFHFIYDTLPYLITYKKLKEQIKELKLLINYPNKQSNHIYNFVLDCFKLLNIKKEDIIILNEQTTYKEIYFSDSYTHGINSNLPPRKEIFDLYNRMVNSAYIYKDIFSIHRQDKKIYVSRRSWIHNDYSNMGTDYTTRRIMVNENDVVSFLKTKGYEEVFSEKLSMIEKIFLFDQSSHIIGPFGGGLCNVVFSRPSCKLGIINSPGALKVNQRFLNCFSNVKCDIFHRTNHNEQTHFKKYMRVQYKNIIGEVESQDASFLTISYTDDIIAGWNNKIKYKKIRVNKKDCKKLDDGLNSPWQVDFNKFIQWYNDKMI